MTYEPPQLLANGHLLTIYPSLFRKLPLPEYRRERIPTPDEDFLDLDWSSVGARRAVVISHGLEGSTERPYIVGMVHAFNKAGWDAVAWNFRSCSGEPNNQVYAYHSGRWQDVHTVCEHVLASGLYDELALVGFSMGGNMSLMYLGQQETKLDARMYGCVVFSVPCDLESGAVELAKWQNKLYMRRFLNHLHKKIKWKMEKFPGKIDDAGYSRINSFAQFDDRYVAPYWGFRDALDYWRKASSKPYIPRITVPTLLVNAQDDPFLAPACYPVAEAEENPFFTLLQPKHGGHVGFVQFNQEKEYWSEKVAVTFLQGLI
ncbi:MAG: alpha/beta fold hydrolase [Deferribacteres bacterium]|nr:alpha/beta fold hydrolase [candidate division KSB1 bacterium]MCB9503893.1 alpha/beta fold hydrolase [Deferribacteres bacterium]